MNTLVDSSLRQAVQNFDWDEESSVINPPFAIDFQDFVQCINEKIKAVFQLKPMLEIQYGSLSLADVTYLVIQDKEPLATTRIQNASNDQKILLNHVFQKLSNIFEEEHSIQIESQELKQMTILFGINKICELASPMIKLNPTSPEVKKNLSIPEQTDYALQILIRERRKFENPSNEMEKQLLFSIDQTIVKTKKLLENLKKPNNI